MIHDERALMAANNNADLCEAMFASHDLQYDRTPFAFVGQDSPPPYYSNLTVLAPGYVPVVRTHLNTLAHHSEIAIGLKDSFCEHDLLDHGFDILFEASWI